MLVDINDFPISLIGLLHNARDINGFLVCFDIRLVGVPFDIRSEFATGASNLRRIRMYDYHSVA